MNMKFEYIGLTPELTPFKSIIEIISVDNKNAILHCRSSDGKEKTMTYEVFNQYLQSRQLVLIS